MPVVLTVYQDDDRIIQALCAGARGYLLNGRVLRPAMVTVAMNADSEAGEPNAGNA